MRARYTSPLWTVLLVIAALCAVALKAEAGGCSLKDDGITLRLENDFFRLTLRPPKGGTCLDFFYKPTKKQLVPPVEALPLFAERTDMTACRSTGSSWQQSGMFILYQPGAKRL